MGPARIEPFPFIAFDVPTEDEYSLGTKNDFKSCGKLGRCIFLLGNYLFIPKYTNMGNEEAENGDFGQFNTFVRFYGWQVRFSEISSTSTMLLVLYSSVV